MVLLRIGQSYIAGTGSLAAAASGIGAAKCGALLVGDIGVAGVWSKLQSSCRVKRPGSSSKLRRSH